MLTVKISRTYLQTIWKIQLDIKIKLQKNYNQSHYSGMGLRSIS